MGFKLQIFLGIQYALIVVVSLIEGNYAKALYWVGAIILLTGVILMK